MYTLTTSTTNTFWHIMAHGQVMFGAPKRGHGRATRTQMIDWVAELNAEVTR